MFLALATYSMKS